MAFKKNYTDPSNTNHPNAYSKILEYNLNPVAEVAFAYVVIYHDKKTRDDKKQWIPEQKYKYWWFGTETQSREDDPLSQTKFAMKAYKDIFSTENLKKLNNDPLKIIYEEIKTLPDWDGWLDN